MIKKSIKDISTQIYIPYFNMYILRRMFKILYEVYKLRRKSKNWNEPTNEKKSISVNSSKKKNKKGFGLKSKQLNKLHNNRTEWQKIS